jgi:hypothetical protein
VLASTFVVSTAGFFIPFLPVKILSVAWLIGMEGYLCPMFAIIFNETTSSASTLRSKGVTIFSTFYGVGGITFAGVTLLIPSSNNLCGLLGVCTIVIITIIAIVIIEPPKRLHKQGQISELFKTLHQLSIVNKDPISTGKNLKFLTKRGASENFRD